MTKILPFAYADTPTGRQLAFLARMVDKHAASKDLRMVAFVARVGARLSGCNVWASLANLAESMGR